MPRLLLLAILSLSMTAVYGCGGETATEDTDTSSSSSGSSSQKSAAAADQKFDTPEAVYAAFVEAGKKKDYNTFALLLTEDSQVMMAGVFIFGASVMKLGDENKEKELKELLGKHGIDMDAEEEPPEDPADASPEAMMKAMTKPIKNLPAFIGELGAWMTKNGDDKSSGFPEMKELGKVTIDGDSAKAVRETDMGPRPIEFHKVNGSWLIHLPMDGPGGDTPPELEEPEDDGTPGLDTLWYDGKANKLRHVVAYKSKCFDDPCTVVLLTTKAIDDRKMDQLKQSLKKDGNDDAFFVFVPQIKLSLDAECKLMFINAWIDNASISSNSGVEVDIKIEDKRVHGTARKTDANKGSDKELRFEATFDVALMQAE